jgi:thiol-disulfide isomerase/thioredoxin
MSKFSDFLSRRSALAAIALTATGAGAWMAWRKNQNLDGGRGTEDAAQNAAKPTNASPEGVPSDASALKALWALELDMPQGGTLKIASLRGKPMLVNFWAPWCPPCVEEMPLLDSFFRENLSKSWQVVGLAVDQPKQVQQFLLKTPVSFPIALAGYAGIDVTRTFGNITGGLPFTMVLDSQGNIAARHMGKLTAEHLSAFAAIR